MQMKNQVAQMKLAGSLKSSTEVMKAVSGLIKLPELQKTMQSLSKEMMKAGIIDELVQDSLDTVLDTDDIETETDAEVEKVIFEVTQGKLKDLPAINNSLPASATAGATAATVSDDEDEEPLEDMRSRLEALRS